MVKLKQTLWHFLFQTAEENYSEGELCIDVENVMKTGSVVNDIDCPSVQSSAVIKLPYSTCSPRFKSKDSLTSHTATDDKQGL